MTSTPTPAFTIQHPPDRSKFRELARLLSREDDPPKWLCRFFEDWAPCLCVDRGVHLIQPTRKEMRRRLAQVSTAADFLIGALNDTATTEFLDPTGTQSAKYAGMAAALLDMKKRAADALNSASLATSRGRTSIRSRKGTAARQFLTKGILCGYRCGSMERCSRELSCTVKYGRGCPGKCLLGGVRRTYNGQLGQRSLKGLAPFLR